MEVVSSEAPLWGIREKLIGYKVALTPRPKRDLLDEKLISIEYSNGDCLFPMLHVDEQVLNRMSVPWKEALIVKLLGKKELGYQLMKSKMKEICYMGGNFDIMDVG